MGTTPRNDRAIEHSGDKVDSRLRLKRSMLWALIGSLGAGALLASAVLLFGQFNYMTSRILITLMALALHSGMGIACAETLERRLWPGLSRAGLVLLVFDFVAFTVIWWSTTDYDAWGRAAVVMLLMVGYYLAAIPPASLLDQGRHRWLVLSTLVLCVVGFAAAVVSIWMDYYYGHLYLTIGRQAAIVGTLACAGACVCLVVRGPVDTLTNAVRVATIICIGLLALVVSRCIWVHDVSELMARLLGSLGVLGVCGGLTLLILARIRKVQGVVHLESSAKAVELRCPRCSGMHTISIGDSACPQCGLRFHIDIEEPRCARCGYLLWQLTERRCPECGESF